MRLRCHRYPCPGRHARAYHHTCIGKAGQPRLHARARLAVQRPHAAPGASALGRIVSRAVIATRRILLVMGHADSHGPRAIASESVLRAECNVDGRLGYREPTCVPDTPCLAFLLPTLPTMSARVRHRLHRQPGWHRLAGLICLTLPYAAACCLSPTVAESRAPQRATHALQLFERQALQANPGCWYRFCLLLAGRESRGP